MAVYDIFNYTNQGTYVQIDSLVARNAYAGAVNIPSTIESLPVTTLRTGAFDQCSKITSVTIPNSVTTIGANCLRNCSLITVTIPSSVTSLGDNCLQYCGSLTSINVDSNNTVYSSIDGVLFNKTQTTLIQFPNKNSITNYTIPSSVTSLGTYCFFGCTLLVSVTIPNSITAISTSSFESCSNLTNVTFQNTALTIGETAFQRTGIVNLNLPEGLTSISTNAFSYCEKLTSIYIPKTLTSIISNAFIGLTNVETVTVGTGSTKFVAENNILYNYTKNTIIILPKTITNLNLSTTVTVMACLPARLPELTSITADASNTGFTVENNILYNKNKTTLLISAAKGAPATIAIPSTVTSISNTYAFADNINLTSLSIPSTVTTFNSTFPNCPNLTTLTVDAANTNYSAVDNVLYNKAKTYLIKVTNGCPSNYVMPNTVTSFYSNAFHDCSSITSITFSNGITNSGLFISLKESLFKNCNNLINLFVDPNYSHFKVYNNILCSKPNCTYIFAYPPAATTPSITLPNNCTTIYSSAFANNSYITSITIPNTITTIYSNAFANCNNLSEAKFLGTANTLKIDNTSFSNCAANFTIKYLESMSSGWTNPFFGYATAIFSLLSMGFNLNGIWKTSSDIKCNINGVWKTVTDIWTNIEGTWKKNS